MFDIKWFQSQIIVIIFLSLGFFAIKATAQQRMDLSGKWMFSYDAGNYGMAEGWYRPGYALWDTVSVPSSYNDFGKAGDTPWYSGIAWYRKKFTIPKDWSEGRFLIRFLAVNLRAQVWVNGQPVGSHESPYLPFQFNITDHIDKDGPNWVVVRVSNKIQKRAIPDRGWYGWWNYGGIIRDVSVIHQPDKYIQNTSIKTTIAKKNNDHVWDLHLSMNTANIANKTDANIAVKIKDAVSGQTVWETRKRTAFLKGDNHQSFQTQLNNIHPWSPDSPALYDATITLKNSTSTLYKKNIRFGFRQIQTEGAKILLNGKPILLKGINRHEMYPGEGMTLSEAHTKADLEDIKSLGANMIRTTHYAQSSRVYDLADSLGLLAWVEIPAWHTSTQTLISPKVWSRYTAPQLKSMVHWYRSHPSIIIWSVGNEFNSNSEDGAAYVKRATRFVRRLDSTRLVTFASNDYSQSSGRDRSFKHVNLIAMNEYFGWYYGKEEEVGPTLDKIHNHYPDKPIIVSEVGAGAIAGHHKSHTLGSDKDYSVEHQVDFLRTHLNLIYAKERRGFVAGSLVWTYNDFPQKQHRQSIKSPEVKKYLNYKGIVTQERKKKPSYKTVQKIFNNLPGYIK